MACREYKNILSAYIDEELKPLTRMRVESHLRGCGRCRRQLRQTLAFDKLFFLGAPEDWPEIASVCAIPAPMQ